MPKFKNFPEIIVKPTVDGKSTWSYYNGVEVDEWAKDTVTKLEKEIKKNEDVFIGETNTIKRCVAEYRNILAKQFLETLLKFKVLDKDE